MCLLVDMCSLPPAGLKAAVCHSVSMCMWSSVASFPLESPQIPCCALTACRFACLTFDSVLVTCCCCCCLLVYQLPDVVLLNCLTLSFPCLFLLPSFLLFLLHLFGCSLYPHHMDALHLLSYDCSA